MDIDDLFAVASLISDGRIVVCTARRSELAVLDDNVIPLTPESLPDGLLAASTKDRPTDPMRNLRLSISIPQHSTSWSASSSRDRTVVPDYAATHWPQRRFFSLR